jgi:hypothetical protein
VVGRLSAQVALLAFAGAILAGLNAGNEPNTVILRALGCMFVSLMLGQFVAWVFKVILRDHLQSKKGKIDQSHLEAVKAILSAEKEAAEAAQQAKAAQAAEQPSQTDTADEEPLPVVVDEEATAQMASAA